MPLKFCSYIYFFHLLWQQVQGIYHFLCKVDLPHTSSLNLPSATLNLCSLVSFISTLWNRLAVYLKGPSNLLPSSHQYPGIDSTKPMGHHLNIYQDSQYLLLFNINMPKNINISLPSLASMSNSLVNTKVNYSCTLTLAPNRFPPLSLNGSILFLPTFLLPICIKCLVLLLNLLWDLPGLKTNVPGRGWQKLSARSITTCAAIFAWLWWTYNIAK